QTLRREAKGYKLQAIERKEVITPEKYYNLATNASLASERWEYALEYKKYFPNDNHVQAAIDHAAEKNLELAMKNHKKGNFNSAAEYYNRISKETLVSHSIRIKAESYYYLAINKLNLTNTIVKTTNYGITLEKMINTQMGKSPQMSQNGGWRNATKDEVKKYVNPLTGLPADLSNLSYALTTVEIITSNLRVRTGPGTIYNEIGSVHKGEIYTILSEENGWYKIGIDGKNGWISGSSSYVRRNTEILQHLVLSGSSGISSANLNQELRGAGILEGKGNIFL